MIFAFDLDGTIAPYGEAVPPDIADALNALGPIHIISGGKREHMEQATQLIKEKTLHSMADVPGNHRIDLSRVLDIPKGHFCRTELQETRRRMVMALRSVIGSQIYTGGRSTIDIMLACTKGDVVRRLGKPVTYFYDCQWNVNTWIHNDIPAIEAADYAIQTDYTRIVEDLKSCLS